MRTCRRVILTILTAIFVFLWIATASLWLRSHSRGDSYLRPGNPRSWLVISGDGGLAVAMCNHPGTPSTLNVPSPWQKDVIPQYPKPGQWVKSIRFSGTITIRTSASAGVTVTSPAPTSLTVKVGSVTLSGSRINARTFAMSGIDTDLASIPLPNSGTVTDSQFHAYRVDGTGVNPARTWVVIFPYWIALLILMIPTLGSLRLWLLTHRRDRRLRDGCCAACGYDLRATPNRCPECGAAPVAVTG